MELNLGGKRVLVAGGSDGKLLISHIVLTAVATRKVRLVTSSREGTDDSSLVRPGSVKHGDRPDVAALTDQVGDDPMLLPLLDGLHGESQRLAPSQPAAQQERDHRVVV